MKALVLDSQAMSFYCKFHFTSTPPPVSHFIDSAFLSKLKREIVDRNTVGIAIDENGLLEAVWARTYSREYIHELINLLEPIGAIDYITKIVSIPSDSKKKMRIKYGGPTGEDLKILEICYSSCDKILLTYDHHFWDPKASQPQKVIGDTSAKLAKYLHAKLGIKVSIVRHILND